VSVTGAPAVVIRLPIEGAPVVRLDVRSVAERERLLDWITSQLELLEIVARAEDAAEAWRAGELPRRTA
jgi:hypothetical protein